MDIRKIAVVGGFAVGAALTLAPLASADNTTDLTSAVSSEISSLNSLFTADTTAATVPAADIETAADGFKLIVPADVSTLESSDKLFDELVYGFNYSSNLTNDPGAYDVLNGAVAKFDDALNFGVYALENGGNAIPVADFATAGSEIATQLAGETATQAIVTLLGDSYSDLLGYF
jgi:hypothetical protein